MLFDQGTPVPLHNALPGHEVSTAYELGWSTLKNGELLRMAEERGFDALVTTDTNLRYAHAVVSFQTQVARSESAKDMREIKGYRECASNKLTDAAFAKAMDNHFISHPEAIAQPIVLVALNTLREICKPYLGVK